MWKGTSTSCQVGVTWTGFTLTPGKKPDKIWNRSFKAQWGRLAPEIWETDYKHTDLRMSADCSRKTLRRATQRHAKIKRLSCSDEEKISKAAYKKDTLYTKKPRGGRLTASHWKHREQEDKKQHLKGLKEKQINPEFYTKQNYLSK